MNSGIHRLLRPTIIDGRLYARGSSDNKGSLLSRYIAVDAYQKVLGKLPINIKFVAEGEEEIGSPHLMDFIRDNPEKIQSDGIIWEGGSKVVNGPLVVHMGVKGVTTFEIVCKEPKNHSNPVWRLIWALNSMKNADDYITVDHFDDSIAPLTEYERNFVLNNDYDEEAMKKMNGIDHFVRDLTGNALKEKLYTEPSMNIQGLYFREIDPVTGMPKSAAVKMDIRTVPNQEPEELMRQLRNTWMPMALKIWRSSKAILRCLIEANPTLCWPRQLLRMWLRSMECLQMCIS